MRVYLGADHGGFKLKEKVKAWLKERGEEVVDEGAEKLEKGDSFVDYGLRVARKLGKEGDSRGILFCRNGLGMVIVANRVRRVRCGLGFEVGAVRKGRSDDDINCLAVPADYVGFKQTREMIEVFLETSFSGQRRFRERLLRLARI